MRKPTSSWSPDTVMLARCFMGNDKEDTKDDETICEMPNYLKFRLFAEYYGLDADVAEQVMMEVFGFSINAEGFVDMTKVERSEVCG